MYTLRRIFKDDTEHNFALGENYGLVLRSQNGAGAQFKKALAAHLDIEVGEKMTEEKVNEGNKIYGFVSSDCGKLYALFQNCRYYIMTETGKTFSNLSLK